MNIKKIVFLLTLPLVLASCASYNDNGCLEDEKYLYDALYEMYQENGVAKDASKVLATYGVDKFDLTKICITKEMLEEVVQFDSFK